MDAELIYNKIKEEWDSENQNDDKLLELYSDLINSRSEDFIISMLKNRAHFYYFYRNEFDKAMEDYADALELSIKDNEFEDIIDVYNGKGDIYFDLKKYDSAINEYNKAIQIYNSLTEEELIRFIVPPHESYLKLGNLYFEIGNYKLALDYYNMGEINYKGDVDLYIGISLCQLKLNNINLALINFDEIIDKFYREQSSNNVTKGEYWFKRHFRNLNKILLRENSLERFPELFSRGVYHLFLQKYDLAISDFDILIKINQFFIPTYFFKGISYLLQNNYDLFVNNFELAVTYFPEYRDRYNMNVLKFAKIENITIYNYYNYKGEGYSKLENNKEALINYLISLNIFTDKILEKNNLSYQETLDSRLIKLQFQSNNHLDVKQSFIWNKEFDIAKKLEMLVENKLDLSNYREDFEDYLNRFWNLKYFNLNLIDYCIKYYPDNAKIYLFRAMKHFQQNNNHEALKDCIIATKLNPNMKEGFFNAAVAYYKLENYQESLNLINLAFETDNNDYTGYYTRGLIYLKLGKYTQSIIDFNTSIDLDQNVADAYFGRAKAYIRVKDFNNAIYDLEKALSIDSNMKESIDDFCKQENIVLKYFQEKKERSRNISSSVRNDVWNRANGKCEDCGSQVNLEFDHIIPFSKGGSNTYRNIQLLCESCNRKKYNNIG